MPGTLQCTRRSSAANSALQLQQALRLHAQWRAALSLQQLLHSSSSGAKGSNRLQQLLLSCYQCIRSLVVWNAAVAAEVAAAVMAPTDRITSRMVLHRTARGHHRIQQEAVYRHPGRAIKCRC
jgi:hypothetical protein